MTSPPPCLAEETLRGFACGRLAVGEADRVGEHLLACPACRTQLGVMRAELTTEADGGECSGQTDPLLGATATTRPYVQAPEDEELTLDLDFLDPPVRPTSLGVLGDYDVVGVLGGGGMGVVFKAFDQSLHRTVAIKVMAPRLASSQRARRRFVREARAAAAVNHPNVMTIHAVSVHKDMPYIVMEYIAGQSLRQRIRADPPLDPDQVLRIGHQIASGLAAAHEQGVIHRDIKPANIMLEDGLERVKIADFGLALAAIDHSALTSVDQTVGTPAYMSPEQVTSSSQVDPRSDLFSFGCVLYAMLTGHSPFQGGHTLEVIRNVCDHHPTPVHQINTNVRRDFSAVVHRLLEKDPKDRFQSAGELAAILSELLAAANAAGAHSVTTRLVTRALRPAGPTRALAALAAATALAAGALVWGFWPINTDGFRAPPAPVGGTEAVVGPPEVPVVLVVARDLPADARTIAGALERARPGATVRIADDATYTEEVRVVGPRFTGLTIEAPRGAVLRAPDSSASVVTVQGVPRVALRGLTLRPRSGQHALVVSGAVEGLRVEGVRMTQEDPGSHKAVVYVVPGTHGSAAHPVVFRGLDVDCGTLGLTVFGRAGEPASWFRVEGSTFRGTGVLLLIDTSASDVTVAGNVFVGGLTGINLNLHLPRESRRVAVLGNSFFRTRAWLGMHDTDLDQVEVTVARNLALESGGVSAAGQDLARVAAAWFRDNVWEPVPGTDHGHAFHLAEVRESVPVRSREPSDPHFLVPETGAGLLARNPDGTTSPIGAKSGATTESAPGRPASPNAKAADPP